MKKNYFITLILTMCFSMLSFAQTPMITMILDGDCSGGNPKMLEIYASGTVDFSLYTLEKQSNANTSWSSAQSLSDFGTVTDAFVYVSTAGSSTALATEFPSITSVLESDAINVNGMCASSAAEPSSWRTAWPDETNKVPAVPLWFTQAPFPTRLPSE